MAKKPDPPADTRERILAAALELFMAQSVERTSVAELCRRAGVSNGSFFHHFPNKEDVALEITLALRREYWDYVLAAMEPCADPMQGIEGVIRAAFAYQREFPDRYRLGRSDDTPWMRDNVQRVRDDNAPYRGRAARWIAAHVAEGRLPLLLPEIYGAMLFGTPHWILRNTDSGSEPTDLKAAADQLVQSVRKALKP
jgi:AcrR family transcriptional regulator